MADAWRGPPRTVGPYEIRLDFEGREPRVVASKKGKPLKAVPGPVRESDDYQKLVEMADALGDQVARSRDAIENLMAAGRPLDRENLARLAELPAAASQFDRLLFEDEAARRRRRSWRTGWSIMVSFSSMRSAWRRMRIRICWGRRWRRNSSGGGCWACR